MKMRIFGVCMHFKGVNLYTQVLKCNPMILECYQKERVIIVDKENSLLGSFGSSG